ncbi:DoxX family protein [Methylobacterium oxalidis]|uniref:DoxX family protein n=1 Tax=Methylobacterium oxalidis TaxID=944322 RepID=UPI003315C05F
MSTRTAGQILRVLIALFFLIAAGMKFAGTEFEVSGFQRFGYAPWFMYLIGALQAAGAALLVMRATAALGAGLLAVIMLGAVASHLRAGDPVTMAVPAFILLVVLAGIAVLRLSATAGARQAA